MTQEVGGSIGKRIAALAFHAANRTNTISLGIVTKVHLDTIKADVLLKTAKGINIVELYNCPIMTQSYSGGAFFNVPKENDLVVVLHSKYNIENQIKVGSLAVTAADEIDVAEQNYGIIIGTIFPLPETEANPPIIMKPNENAPSETNVLQKDPREPEGWKWDGNRDNNSNVFPVSSEQLDDEDPRFLRPPVFHSEKLDYKSQKDRTKRFVRGETTGGNGPRLDPKPYHQIWYHPFDHEIRMTREEIHIKHKTGSQIIFREEGDLDIYVWKKLNIHAKENIIIESESRATLLSFVPEKERPWRVS